MNIKPVNDTILIEGEQDMKKTHVGVIGAGMISHTYLDTLTQKFPHIQVDAISDLNPGAVSDAAKRYNLRIATNEEILSDPEIEIVLNLTPPAVHKKIISDILNAGKHAYTEKCLALDVKTARELCELADHKGKYLGTAPDTFFSGWAQNARRIIDSGELGTITGFAMVGNRDNERLLSAMPYMTKPGGGIILDYSVYYLTMLVNLLGPVKRVSATIKAPYPTHVNSFELSPHFGETFDTPNESQFYSILELENGITGTMSINADSVFFDQTYFAIYGNKGILYGGCPDWFPGEVSIYRNTYDFSKAETPERIVPDNPFGFRKDSRGVGLADLAVAVREGRKPRASAWTALHVLDIQECMVKSDQENGAFVTVETTAERALPLVPKDTEESSLITK